MNARNWLVAQRVENTVQCVIVTNRNKALNNYVLVNEFSEGKFSVVQY